jgi:hypothetical protein
MKNHLKFTLVLCVWMLLGGSITAPAQNVSGTDEVKQTIRQFFKAMATRDLDHLRDVVDVTFTVVKAGRETAKTYVLEASKGAELLPRNDDWENIQISSMKIQVSSTNPSVAVASFALVQPPGANSDRYSAFAMLARREGKWRIVSISIPD